MRFTFIGIFFILFSISGASAAESTTLAQDLSLQDYFIIFVVGIIALAIFVSALRRVSQRRITEKPRSAVLTVAGTLFALVCIAIGSCCIIFASFSLLSVGAQVTIFDWIVTLLVAYASSFIAGIFGLILFGFLFFFLGITILSHLQGKLFDTAVGTPQKVGPSQKETFSAEFLHPTITYKILNRNREAPGQNVRVILKKTNGTNSYIRTTNIEGDVTFDHIDGYATDYYAYVEGDEGRDLYRVIRTK